MLARFHAVLLPIGVLMILSIPSAFADRAEQDGSTLAETTMVDRAQHSVSAGVNSFAQWIDSFFYDERFVVEDASTRLRLSEAVLLEQGRAARFKTRLNVKLDIPHFKNKLKLFVSSEDERNNQQPDNLNENILNSNIEEDAQLGLQYFARSSRKRNLSLTLGVKLESLEVFAGPRLRRTWRLDGWQLRFTQRLRWFSKQSWRATTQVDLEKLLAPRLLFRQIVEGRWRRHDDGYRYQISPTLVQVLKSKKAIEYQWGNFFKTRPRHVLDESVLSIRYRRRFWRNWLFYEFVPQLAFRNDDDFDPLPGINLRLEIVFGGNVNRRSVVRVTPTQ